MSKEKKEKNLVTLAVDLICLGPRIMKRAALNVADTCDDISKLIEELK